MRGVAGAVAFLTLAAYSATCGAQYSPQQPYLPPPPMYAPLPDVHYFLANGQSYMLSTSGLRDYVETLRDDPELYRPLDAKISSLETRNTWAWIVGVGSVAGGLALMIFGAGTENQDTRAYLFLGGTGVLLVGTITAGFAIAPGDADLMEVVSEHNRLNALSPLEVSKLRQRPLGARLSFRF